MCRKSLDGVDLSKFLPNVLFAQLLVKLFPSEMQEREKEENEEKEDEMHKVCKKIYVGNRHEFIQTDTDNHHKWTFFVDNADSENEDISEYVEKIVINLHPTFHPSTITLTKKPYQVARYGWGTFTILAKIYFKDFLKKPPVSFSHYLSFGFGGEKSTHIVEFDRRNCAFLDKKQGNIQLSDNEEELIVYTGHHSGSIEISDSGDDDIIFLHLSDSEEEDEDLQVQFPH